jgi:hypothetical protein
MTWSVFMSKLPCLFGNPALMVWPSQTYCIWPCQARQKYSCTVRSISGLQHSPPQMKNHGFNEGKPYRRKNNLSIESSEVNMWLVRILTTKRKSLKRVETCQKKCFTFWLFVMLTRSSDLIFQMVFTLWIYIYMCNLFRIELLIVHSYLNDVVLI